MFRRAANYSLNLVIIMAKAVKVKRSNNVQLSFLVAGLLVLLAFFVHEQLGMHPQRPYIVYVLNPGNGNLSEINGSTDMAIETISVGSTLSDAQSMALDSGSDKIFVLNQYANNYLGPTNMTSPVPAGSVSVVNLTTNKVASISSPQMHPVSIAIASNSQLAYVLNLNGRSSPLSEISNGSVSVINTANYSIVKSIQIGLEPPIYNGTWPGIAVTPDGSTVYASNCKGGTIYAINTTNYKINSINIGPLCPTTIKVAPNGRKVYSLLAGSPILSAINTNNQTISGNVFATEDLSAFVISNDSSKIYAIGGNWNSTGILYTINTSTNKITNQVIVGMDPSAILLSKNNSNIYVANIGPYTSNRTFGTVLTMNSTTGKVIYNTTVGIWPDSLALSPDGTMLYVANDAPGLSSFSYGSVSVIDTQTGQVIKTVKVGSLPSQIIVSNQS